MTAISTFRFAAVGLGSTGGSLEVELRGSPDELVTLLFAREDHRTWDRSIGELSGL